ncbi:MAG: DNA gyrase inhibitor YacG [Planctomycetota bacterium]
MSETSKKTGERRCPKCRGPVTARDTTESPAFPFCSDRCRLVDLGQWFNEEYRVSRPAHQDDELPD